MTPLAEVAERIEAPASAPVDCWNRIGVHGDRSCPELVAHVHCRNCGVYARAAARLLDHEPPHEYLLQWTRHVSLPPDRVDAERTAVLIFRVGAEWLALPGHAVAEVCELRPIHSLPHRRRGVMLGLVNVRGELLACVSLARALGIDERGLAPAGRLVHQRMIVLRSGETRLVGTADEVHGLHTAGASALVNVPATVAKGAATHVRAMLTWRERSVGVLDHHLLFSTFRRSLG